MTVMTVIFVVVAVCLGGLVPFQAGINANAGAHLGHALWGAVTNTTVATLALLTAVLPHASLAYSDQPHGPTEMRMAVDGERRDRGWRKWR